MQRQGGVLTAARGYVDASSTSSRVYLVSPTSVKSGLYRSDDAGRSFTPLRRTYRVPTLIHP
jgi:hypothetical protein